MNQPDQRPGATPSRPAASPDAPAATPVVTSAPGPRPAAAAAASAASAGIGWWPHPALSVLLAAVWLLLQQSLALPNLLTALALAFFVPRLVHGYIGDATHPRALPTVFRFTALVLWDIVISNLTVARIVLSPASNPQPLWIEIPLDTQHPTAITLLASVITMTPGTVSCVVDDGRGKIVVHVLDCSDGPALVAQIKQRYEAPLMEIFG